MQRRRATTEAGRVTGRGAAPPPCELLWRQRSAGAVTRLGADLQNQCRSLARFSGNGRASNSSSLTKSIPVVHQPSQVTSCQPRQESRATDGEALRTPKGQVQRHRRRARPSAAAGLLGGEEPWGRRRLRAEARSHHRDHAMRRARRSAAGLRDALPPGQRRHQASCSAADGQSAPPPGEAQNHGLGRRSAVGRGAAW